MLNISRWFTIALFWAAASVTILYQITLAAFHSVQGVVPETPFRERVLRDISAHRKRFFPGSDVVSPPLKHFRTPPTIVATKKTGLSYAVTGGHGFLGSHVVEALLARGETRITIVDALPSHLFEKEIASGIVTFKQANITSLPSLLTSLHGIDTVIHTAAMVDFSSRLSYNYETIRNVNVIGTQNVIDACNENGVKKLIHTSSATVVLRADSYAKAPFPMNKSEEFFEPLLPSQPKDSLCHYTSTKLEAERRVLAANSTTLKTVAIRPLGIFGPRDSLISNLVHDKNLPIADSNANYDFIYVENVVHAMLCAEKALDGDSDNTENEKKKKNDDDDGVGGHAYFISAGEVWSYMGFQLEMARRWGYQRKTVSIIVIKILAPIIEALLWVSKGKLPLGQLLFLTPPVISLTYLDLVFNDSKARERLKYKPLYTVSEAIDLSLAYNKQFRNAKL